MDLVDRQRFLSGLADGSTALRDVGMLSPHDVDAIARVGAAALTGGRYQQAEQVFFALTALEPDQPLHWLHVAVARQGRGDVDGAVAALGALLQQSDDDEAGEEDRARALLLRAELTGRRDAAAARADLAAARALSSAGAKKVVDAALGVR
jgi:tetratricopeptide (TPR) repeat protein